jgi:pimeloyl-ACP methyl ester carboxylesterase
MVIAGLAPSASPSPTASRCTWWLAGPAIRLGRSARLRRGDSLAFLGAGSAPPDPGYGHFMAEEAPAEIARALRELLAC